MGIFQRISDIISANLNDIVDEYEDPEQMLRQAIREMEQAIAKAKPEVAQAMATSKTIGKELKNNEKQVELWGERASTAVESGDDDAARKALKRKREYESIAAALTDQHTAAEETSGTLRRQLEAMQAKLGEAQRRLASIAARKKAANVRSKAAKASLNVDVDDNAFSKFDRLSKKVEMAEAEAEALAELAASESARSDPLSDELPAEDPDADIEAELANLKRKSGKVD